jgi:GT2 family glycosyltransferase
MIGATPERPLFPDDVDVAVVSHNGRETLPRVLECLVASGAPLGRISVYDIASTDDTVSWLATAWPAVTVRRLPENVGPNPARNRALRDATRPILLLLDSDAFVRPDAAARLRDALDVRSGVGVVTPVVVHAERPSAIQYASVDLHFICEAVNRWVNRPLADRGADRADIGSAPGVALLIDVATARAIGLWDERYFMGKDDGDFCFRLRLAGYRLVEEPRAVVEHGSRPRSTWMFRYQIRNRWYFMLKNYGGRTLLVLLPALCVHELLQLGVLTVKGHLPAWWKALRELARWLPEIGPSRRAVQQSRKVPDRALLVSAPLLVRSDLVGGAAGTAFKRLYDGWLGAYWAIARHLVS